MGKRKLFKWSWSCDQDGCQCIYMVKYPLNLLRNQQADDLQTWYTASRTSALQSLFKWWSWVDLDLLYGKVEFASYCFCMGICLHTEVFELKFGIHSWLSEYTNTHKYERSRSLFDICRRSLRFILSDICCKATGPIEAKFHVELFWVGRRNWGLGPYTVCSNNDPG